MLELRVDNLQVDCTSCRDDDNNVKLDCTLNIEIGIVHQGNEIKYKTQYELVIHAENHLEAFYQGGIMDSKIESESKYFDIFQLKSVIDDIVIGAVYDQIIEGNHYLDTKEAQDELRERLKELLDYNEYNILEVLEGDNNE